MVLGEGPNWSWRVPKTIESTWFGQILDLYKQVSEMVDEMIMADCSCASLINTPIELYTLFCHEFEVSDD